MYWVYCYLHNYIHEYVSLALLPIAIQLHQILYLSHHKSTNHQLRIMQLSSSNYDRRGRSESAGSGSVTDGGRHTNRS